MVKATRKASFKGEKCAKDVNKDDDQKKKRSIYRKTKRQKDKNTDDDDNPDSASSSSSTSMASSTKMSSKMMSTSTSFDKYLKARLEEEAAHTQAHGPTCYCGRSLSRSQTLPPADRVISIHSTSSLVIKVTDDDDDDD